MKCQTIRCVRFLGVFFIFLLVFSSVSAYLPQSCPGHRIRHSASQLQEIQGCDVIEGNLVIELVEDTEENWRHYGNLTVKEITGFLMLYSIEHLRSLDIIFPNLSVIRGHNLFSGEYALVIYLLNDLEEVKLSRLTNIVRGSVYIHRNIALSYVSTVNFASIIQSDSHKSYIQADKQKSCDASCKTGYCWSLDTCQNLCSNCVIGTDGKADNQICSEQCIGGCHNKGETGCIACKNFRFHSRCLSSCGKDKFEWDGYKCVTLSECMTKNRLIYENTSCVQHCPWNLKPSYVHRSGIVIPTCIKINTSKPCQGGMISSVEMSKRFHGCKKINGYLHIRLSGSASDNFMELEKNLGQIEEVSDFVNIFKSEFKSLGFLKSLNIIHGHNLTNNRSSFVIRDCKNLERLWQPKNKLIVKKGEIQFYRNPKLCPDTIEDLLGSSFTERLLPLHDDLKYILNGFEASCRKKIIKVESKVMNQNGVIKLALPRMVVAKDIKNLIGYLIYYKEAPEDIKFESGHIDDSWNLTDVTYDDEGGKVLWKEIDKLKPDTRYAFFVTTQMVPSSVTYQSEIFYNTTKRYNPTIPRELIFQQRNKSIELRWTPPKNTNGKIDFYHIKITPSPDSLSEATKQYCVNEGVQPVANRTKDHDGEPHSDTESKPVLSSRKYDTLPKGEIDELEIQLTNFIYFNKTSERRRFRKSLTRTIGDDDNTTKLLLDNSFGINGRKNDIFDLSMQAPTMRRNDSNRSENMELLKVMIMLEPSLEKYTKNMKDANLSDLLSKVDALIANEYPIGETSDAHHFECSSDTEIGYQSPDPFFTTDKLNNSRYIVEVRACHDMTSDVGIEYMAANGMEKCWLCSPPLKREICVLYPDIDVSVQNVSVEQLNSTAIKVKWDSPQFPIQADEVFSYIILVEVDSSPAKSTCANSLDREKVLHINYREAHISIRVGADLHCDYGNRTYSEEKSIHFRHKIPLSNGFYVYLPIIIGFCVILIFIVLVIWSISKMPATINSDMLFNFFYGGIHKPKMDPRRWDHYFEKAGLTSDVVHSREDLQLKDELGEGHFGFVYRGKLFTKKRWIEVAAKRLKNVGKSSAESCEMLINEAKIMLQYRSYYLVKTYGIVSYHYDLFLVMELMKKGSLETFLKDKRRGAHLNTDFGTEKHLLRIAIQIADGMYYLENKNIIHRDLAARNCLLDDHYNAKISDFGMSRIVSGGKYKIRMDQIVPLRRMPPEYFIRREYTTKSDVWSYGVLLWEISMDKTVLPYEHLADLEIEQEIKKGLTLYSSLPVCTPLYFTTVMNQCWKTEPQDRPCFEHIMTTLLAHAKQFNIVEEFKVKSFIYCGEYEENQVYSAMSSDSSILRSKCDEPELNVETPLTFDTGQNSPTTKENIEECKDNSSLTIGEKALARVILIKNSIFFRKIFPFTIGTIHDGAMREKIQRQNSFFRAL